jgi:intracellular septation protein A
MEQVKNGAKSICGVENHRVSSLILGVVGALLCILYISRIANAGWYAITLGIITTLLIVVKCVITCYIWFMFYKEQWVNFKNGLYSFLANILLVIILAIVSVGTLIFFDAATLILEVCFFLLV